MYSTFLHISPQRAALEPIRVKTEKEKEEGKERKDERDREGQGSGWKRGKKGKN